jgi:hypothetical protein
MGYSFCPDTLVSDSIHITPRKRIAVEVVENLIASLKSWSFKSGAIQVREFENPEVAARRPVIQNGQVVEKYYACMR